MRAFISHAILATLAVVVCGCGSSKPAQPAKPVEKVEAQTGKAGDTKACVMQAGGQDVLHLDVPADAECVTKEGAVVLNSEHRSVQVWLVKDAKTVEEALGRVPDEIKDEFKEFTSTDSKDLTVAGSPAKRQQGSGKEADDDDPGTADVIVFKVGEHVFVSCVHGEHINPAAQEWMTMLVEGAKGS